MNKIFLLAILVFTSCSLLTRFNNRETANSTHGWPQWSGDSLNHHNMTTVNPIINKDNVKDLKKKWSFKTNNPVVTTPTVKDGVVYFTENASTTGLSGLFAGGKLYAVNAETGEKIWSKKVFKYTKSKIRNFSRSSPAIIDDKLIIGDTHNNLKFFVKLIFSGKKINVPGASVMAINRHTGKLIWKTVVEDHFASRITMSPITHNGKVYVGVSSIESEIPAIKKDKYKCCTFKGSFVSLDANTGEILWKTPMISGPAAEFSGAPVWGNSPPIDLKRNRIYIGTGNNYHTTKAMMDCVKEEAEATENLGVKKRLKEKLYNELHRRCALKTDFPENRFDSIVALDLDTGRIIWSRKTMPYDAWNVGCGSAFTSLPAPNDACPYIQGMDADFGQAPMLISTRIDGKETDLLIAGQKNGRLWAFNAENGSTVWMIQAGPRGKLGGLQWGAATDGEKVFFQITNYEHYEVTLSKVFKEGKYQEQKVRSGYWGAVDVKTGSLLWQSPDPSHIYPVHGEGINHIIFGKNLGRGYFATAMGPLTYYNGVVFAGSMAKKMLALDAETGQILWNFDTKGSIGSAPSIVNDTLFWGAGYHLGFRDNKLHAFSLDGE